MRVTNIIPTILIIIPAFIISIILILPLPKTTAFGGVATGIIKANEADSVAGIININGLVFIATATEANTGIIICVVAVLDVNSVINVIAELIPKIVTNGDAPSKPAKLAPIKLDNPDT